jgi:hypothetical protein
MKASEILSHTTTRVPPTATVKRTPPPPSTPSQTSTVVSSTANLLSAKIQDLTTRQHTTAALTADTINVSQLSAGSAESVKGTGTTLADFTLRNPIVLGGVVGTEDAPVGVVAATIATQELHAKGGFHWKDSVLTVPYLVVVKKETITEQTSSVSNPKVRLSWDPTAGVELGDKSFFGQVPDVNGNAPIFTFTHGGTPARAAFSSVDCQRLTGTTITCDAERLAVSGELQVGTVVSPGGLSVQAPSVHLTTDLLKLGNHTIGITPDDVKIDCGVEVADIHHETKISLSAPEVAVSRELTVGGEPIFSPSPGSLAVPPLLLMNANGAWGRIEWSGHHLRLPPITTSAVDFFNQTTTTPIQLSVKNEIFVFSNGTQMPWIQTTRVDNAAEPVFIPLVSSEKIATDSITTQRLKASGSQIETDALSVADLNVPGETTLARATIGGVELSGGDDTLQIKAQLQCHGSLRINTHRLSAAADGLATNTLRLEKLILSGIAVEKPADSSSISFASGIAATSICTIALTSPVEKLSIHRHLTAPGGLTLDEEFKCLGATAETLTCRSIIAIGDQISVPAAISGLESITADKPLMVSAGIATPSVTAGRAVIEDLTLGGISITAEGRTLTVSSESLSINGVAIERQSNDRLFIAKLSADECRADMLTARRVVAQEFAGDLTGKVQAQTLTVGNLAIGADSRDIVIKSLATSGIWLDGANIYRSSLKGPVCFDNAQQWRFFGAIDAVAIAADKISVGKEKIIPTPTGLAITGETLNLPPTIIIGKTTVSETPTAVKFQSSIAATSLTLGSVLIEPTAKGITVPAIETTELAAQRVSADAISASTATVGEMSACAITINKTQLTSEGLTADTVTANAAVVKSISATDIKTTSVKTATVDTQSLSAPDAKISTIESGDTLTLVAPNIVLEGAISFARAQSRNIVVVWSAMTDIAGWQKRRGQWVASVAGAVLTFSVCLAQGEEIVAAKLFGAKVALAGEWWCPETGRSVAWQGDRSGQMPWSQCFARVVLTSLEAGVAVSSVGLTAETRAGGKLEVGRWISWSEWWVSGAVAIPERAADKGLIGRWALVVESSEEEFSLGTALSAESISRFQSCKFQTLNLRFEVAQAFSSLSANIAIVSETGSTRLIQMTTTHPLPTAPGTYWVPIVIPDSPIGLWDYYQVEIAGVGSGVLIFDGAYAS